MKVLSFLLFLFFIVLVSAQNNDWQDNYTSTWQRTSNGTQLLVTNNNWLPITYKVAFKFDNIETKVPYGEFVVLPGKTVDFMVADYKIINKKKGWKTVRNDTRVYLGDLTDTQYDESFVYDLPFEKGTSFKLSQGYNGKISHQGKKQLDFNMPVGTTILASRGGLVVKVIDKNSKSCDDPKCIKFNNLIKILHDDGTIMEYLHIKRKSALVKEGERVDKGAPIALSGNVGYSTGPHLHLSLYLTNRENKRNYLSTRFKINTQDILEELKEGETYSRAY